MGNNLRDTDYPEDSAINEYDDIIQRFKDYSERTDDVNFDYFSIVGK